MNWKTTSCVARNLFLAVLCAGVALAEPPLAARAEQPGKLILPKASEAIRGKRIGWNFNNLREVLTAADSDGKLIAAVIIAKRCGWCRIYLAHVLRCDGLNAFSGQAHFVILYPEDDGDIYQFRNLLKAEGYPTTSIVRVRDKTITPVVKISGVVSEAEIVGALTREGLKREAGAPRGGQSAAIGLPRPAACGTNVPTEALEESTPFDVQRGISP